MNGVWGLNPSGVQGQSPWPSSPLPLETHATLPSTSDHLIAKARAGGAEAAVLALRQTAGRGTHGRAWQGAEGNLFLSVLLRPATPVLEAGHWSLLAGLATIEALSQFSAAPTRLSLKWPNDVLQDGAKLAGILTESAVSGDRLDWLVIGIGANLAQAPAVPNRPTAKLEAPQPPPPEAVAQAVLDRLAHWHDAAASGWSPLRTAWLARAHLLGTALRVTIGPEQIEGAFAGLTERAELRLQTPAQLRVIPAGEISIT